MRGVAAKSMKVWLAGFVALAACGSKSRDAPLPPAALEVGPATPRPVPGPRAPNAYVAMREEFRTRLLDAGPSPQPWAPVRPPPGVREIPFRSGDLPLRAWFGIDRRLTSPAPAVLFLHGGFAFGADDWDMARPFRDAGFAVMIPILRGENGSPGSFSLFFDEVDDVIAAAEVLAAQPEVDPARLYVTGHSAGGVLTLFAAMASKRFRAAASLSGAPDASVFRDSGLIAFEHGDEGEYAVRSPLAFASSFECPVRLYVGSEEGLFLDSTRELSRRATAAGLDVAAVVVDGDHFSMVSRAIPLTIDFFQQH